MFLAVLRYLFVDLYCVDNHRAMTDLVALSHARKPQREQIPGGPEKREPEGNVEETIECQRTIRDVGIPKYPYKRSRLPERGQKCGGGGVDAEMRSEWRGGGHRAFERDRIL